MNHFAKKDAHLSIVRDEMCRPPDHVTAEL